MNSKAQKANNNQVVHSVSEYISMIKRIVKEETVTNVPADLSRDLDPVETAIQSQREVYRGNRSSIRPLIYYRGQYSVDFSMLPSVFRDRDFFEREDFFYHEMTVRNPDQFQGKTHLDKLVTMQHYDCPTRLLDITTNPLVALFFACKSYDTNNVDPSHKGAVYVFKADHEDVLYFDSDRALILSCLATFSKTEKEEIWEITQDRVRRGKDYFPRKDRYGIYYHPIIEKLYKEIVRENPSFERDIVPLDVLKSYYIQPNKTNTRIVKQDGAFIISGLTRNDAEADNRISDMTSDVILIQNQQEILDELDTLGINEATLFPELDKVANYLKRKK